MQESEIYDGLTVIFREVFADDDLTLSPSLKADDVPGWDSMKMVLILIATEERFGVRMRSREVDKLANVGDLANLISAKLA